MADPRPRFQMRPIQDDPSVVEERLVRRSHRHRTWLRIMARARRGTRRFGRSIVLTVLVLAAGLFAVAQTGRGQGLALDVAVNRATSATSPDAGPRNTSRVAGSLAP